MFAQCTSCCDTDGLGARDGPVVWNVLGERACLPPLNVLQTRCWVMNVTCCTPVSELPYGLNVRAFRSRAAVMLVRPQS